MLQNALGIGPLINAAVASAFFGGLSAGEKVEFIVIDAVNLSSGSLKVYGRAKGSGVAGPRINTASSGYTTTLALVNLTSGATVAGGTGVTAAGLYTVEVTGMEYGIQFTYASDACTAYVQPATTTR